MTVCGECDFDWDEDAEALSSDIASLSAAYRESVARLLAACGGHRSLLAQRPTPGVWSVLEYVAHVRDVTRFYRERIDAVLADHRPVLPPGPDFSELPERLGYASEDLDAALAGLSAQATAVAASLTPLAPADWARVGVAPGGERSVLVLARRLAHDARHHLVDLDRAHRRLSAGS